MNALKTSISALALLTMAAGGIGAASFMSANAYAADTTQSAPATDQGMRHQHHHADRAAFLEGRIAFLKAVMKITPTQEQAFNGLADAMRANAKDRAAAWEQMKQNHDQPKSAIDQLQTRIKMTQMRTQAQERVLAAFKPLYDTLSPEQKEVANHMMAGRHHHHGMGHGMHGDMHGQNRG